MRVAEKDIEMQKLHMNTETGEHEATHVMRSRTAAHNQRRGKYTSLALDNVTP